MPNIVASADVMVDQREALADTNADAAPDHHKFLPTPHNNEPF
jgi:hypothetical protein